MESIQADVLEIQADALALAKARNTDSAAWDAIMARHSVAMDRLRPFVARGGAAADLYRSAGVSLAAYRQLASNKSR